MKKTRNAAIKYHSQRLVLRGRASMVKQAHITTDKMKKRNSENSGVIKLLNRNTKDDNTVLKKVQPDKDP